MLYTCTLHTFGDFLISAVYGKTICRSDECLARPKMLNDSLTVKQKTEAVFAKVEIRVRGNPVVGSGLVVVWQGPVLKI